MRIAALLVLPYNLISDVMPESVTLRESSVIYIPELFVMRIQQSE